MARRLTPELMDDPRAPRAELERSLGLIRWVNRCLGGSAAALAHLERWSSSWEPGEVISLIDIGAGSADIPVALRRWALRAGHDLRITAIDLHETTLELAREHLDRASAQDPRIGEGITLERADARDLVDIHGPLSFDYSHAGMFLHHLPDIEVLTVLRVMERLSRRGLIWNDLVRSNLARLGVRILTVGQPRMVRHDARVSVEAGFTRADAMDVARRLDLSGWCRFDANVLTQRFTLAGERPL